jgi:spore coat protein U-like protein
MRGCWTRWLVAFAWLFALPAVHAAITCTTITSPGVSINYTSNTTASVQTYFTVSCTRTSTSDPTSVTYDVTADNGMTGARQVNQASLGTSLLKYDFYEDAACTIAWTGKGKITDTITWTGSATGTISKQTSYWGCIVTKQTPTSSGDYTDSVKLTLKYPGNPNVIGTATVDIYAPANCTLSTPAGNISVAYAAFGAQQTGSTTFRVTCTNSMPYAVATDVTQAVLVGLRYTLSLSATAANGTGTPQSFTITATIPGGQAGTCPSGTCSGTNTHTLTISY